MIILFLLVSELLTLKKAVFMEESPDILKSINGEIGYYKLVGKEVVPTNNIKEVKFGQVIVQSNVTMFEFQAVVSTVFLPIDHANFDQKEIVVFETMIFSKIENLDYRKRHSNLFAAIKGHSKAVNYLYRYLDRHASKLKLYKENNK